MKYEDYEQVLKAQEENDSGAPERLLYIQEILYRMQVIKILKAYQARLDKVDNDRDFRMFNHLLINLLCVLVTERRITSYTDYASAARQNTARYQLDDVFNWIRNDMPRIEGVQQKEQVKQYIKVFYVSWENFRECLIKITGGISNDAK